MSNVAGVNESSIDGALEQFIRKTVVPQYNRPAITLNLLRKEPGRGKNLAWDISVGTATGQVFDDGQIITTYQADTPLLATLPWCEYGDTFSITGRAEDAAQYSQTDLGAQFVYRLGEACGRAGFKANNDIYSGAGTTGPNILLGLCVSGGAFDSTGTYAGQSRSTYAQWQGNKIGNGGIPRALSLSLIEYSLEQAFNSSGKAPTFGTTTANLWRRLCELTDSDQRDIKDQVWRNGEVLSRRMGYEAVEVNGIPIFKDVSVPTGNIVFFHEPSVHIEYLRTAPSRIKRGKVMATVQMAGTPQELKEPGMPAMNGPLVANVISLPASGNFEAWMVDATFNFAVERPNANVWITDLSYRTE